MQSTNPILKAFNRINPIHHFKSFQERSIQNRLKPAIQKATSAFIKEFKNQSIYRGTVENYDINNNEIVAYFLKDPFIRAAVNKKVEKIVAAGFIIEPKIEEDITEADSTEADNQKKQFEEWTISAGGGNPDFGSINEKVSFNQILRKMTNSLIVGDNLYLELVYPKDENDFPIIIAPPQELHVMDWEDMKIHTDLNGNLMQLTVRNNIRQTGAYSQHWEGLTKYFWDRLEMLHTTYYASGTRLYGQSLIQSIMFATRDKFTAEKFSRTVFENQRAKGHWAINEADEVEYDKIVDQIINSKKNPEMDVFTQGEGGKITYTPLTKHQDLQFVETIKNARTEICVGIGVSPSSIYWGGQSGGWEGDIEKADMDEDNNAKRDFIAQFMNNNIFPLYGWDKIRFRFNKTNKRDEIKEAEISQKTSDVLTINERRANLGYPPIEEGDQIRALSSGGFSGSSENNAKENDQTGQTGESEGDKELSRSLPDLEATRRNPHAWKTHYGGSGFMSKSITPDTRNKKLVQKPPIGAQKKAEFDKIFAMKNSYARDLNGLLDRYIDKAIEVVERRKVNEIKKAANPTKEFKEMEELKLTLMMEARSIGRGHSINAFDFGFQKGSDDLKLTLTKGAKDYEAIEFLSEMNIDLVEGAMSEAAAKSKTAIRIGLDKGESIPQIVKRLNAEKHSIKSLYKGRFENITRTEVSRAQSEGRLNAYEKSGVVNKVQALIGADPDGQCSINLGGSPGGLGRVMSLEESRGLIPTHPRCTCSWVPYVEGTPVVKSLLTRTPPIMTDTYQQLSEVEQLKIKENRRIDEEEQDIRKKKLEAEDSIIEKKELLAKKELEVLKKKEKVIDDIQKELNQ